MILCRPTPRRFANYMKLRGDRMPDNRHERCYFPSQQRGPWKGNEWRAESETTKEGHHEVITQ